MSAFQADIARFEKHDAQVLGVSSDTLETHAAFARELGLSFPLISDDGTVRRLYGKGRITYLIDTTGVIRQIQTGMPDNDRLLQGLEELAAD